MDAPLVRIGVSRWLLAVLAVLTWAGVSLAADPPSQTLQFSAPAYFVSEAATTVTVTVVRSGPSTGTVTVDYATFGGSAANGPDFSTVRGTLTFGPGIVSRTFTVPIVGNTLAETTESLALGLSNPTGGALLGAQSASTITITDNDPPGSLQFSAATYSAGERSTGATIGATITVRRLGGTASGVTVDYATVSGGTATAGAAYLPTSGTLTFNVGQTSLTFAVPILGNAVDGPNQTVNLALSNPTGHAILGIPSAAVLTIVDDDVPGTISFSAPTYTVLEKATAAQITVRRSGGSAPVAVQFDTADATATAGQDYTAVSTVLSFGVGEVSQVVSVPMLMDGAREGTETIRLRLMNPTGGATLGTYRQALLTITDNETGPTVQFGATAFSVAENIVSGVARISITRTGGTVAGQTVLFSASGGTATGIDFTAVTNREVTFAAGQASVLVDVPILNNNVIVGNRTVNLVLSSGGANPLALGVPHTASLTIVEDDSSIQFSTPTVSVTEGGVATLTVTRTGGTTAAATVAYTTVDGTEPAGARAPTHYVAKAGTLAFGPGVTSLNVTVTTSNNSVVDGPRSFTVTLSKPNPAASVALGPASMATVTINDDDAPGTLQLASATYAVNEGATATLTVTRTGGSAGTVTVKYATSDGGSGAAAIGGTDYTAGTGTLTFLNGATSRTITVPTRADTLLEGPETFTVTLSEPGGGALLGAPASAIVTIVDDETPSIQFNPATYTAAEAAGSVTLKVTRVGPTTAQVTVPYTLAGVTATGGGVDFDSGAGTVTFPPGATSRNIVVPITNDTVNEASETFTVTLSNPTGGGAILGSPATATVTIVDNDPAGAAQLSQAAYAVLDGRIATISVVRNGGLSGPVTVHFATSSGTATTPEEYAETSGTLTFAAGDKLKTFTVATSGNGLTEASKSVMVALTDPTNGLALGSPSTATLWILDTRQSPPTVPTALTATASGSSEINLSWTASTDDVGVTGYRVERCQGAGCTSFAQVGTAAGTTFDDTGLAAGTTYRYRVRAVDTTSNLSSYSSIVSATTPSAADTASPSTPAGLTATAVSSSQINLSWTASTDNVGVTGYRVERCQGAACTAFTEIGQPTGTGYGDTGLAANTAYRYRVRATDVAANLSDYSTIAATTTPSAAAFARGAGPQFNAVGGTVNTVVLPGTTIGNHLVITVTWGGPTTPTITAITVSGESDATLIGSPVVSDSDRAQMAYLANITTGGDKTITVSFSERTNSSVGVMEYAGGNPTNFLDAVATSAGSAGTSPSLTLTTTTDRALIVAVAASSGGDPTVGDDYSRWGEHPNPNFWAETEEDLDAGAAGPRTVNFSLPGNGPWGLMAAAFNIAGAGGSDAIPPSLPTSLTAAVASTSQINLTWGASTDNVGVTGYRVERCQGAGCSGFAQVGTPIAATFINTGLTPGATYSYRVRALDPSGNLGGFSNTASATTPTSDTIPPSVSITAPNAGATVSGTVTITATATDNVAVAGVQFKLDGVALGAEVTGTSPFSLTWNTTLEPNGQHTLTAVARDGANLTATSQPVPLTVSNGDGTGPTVSITAPLANASVAGTVTLAATASDNVAVLGVQFKVNGVNVGAEVTSKPYFVAWNTTGVGDGSHIVTAVARDASQATISAPLTVTVSNATASAPSRVGQWSAVSSWPLVAIHVTLLPDGRILAWDGADQNGAAYLWKPSTNAFTAVPPPDVIFCGGHTLLADGRPFVVGGHIQNFVGIPDANIFTPTANGGAWSAAPSMAVGRWYPTATLLPDGRALVASGSIDCETCIAETPEIYDPVTNTWSLLPPGANLALPLYPHLFVLPDGRVIAGGAFQDAMSTVVLDLATGWSTVDPTVLDAGSSAMFHPWKILKSGTSRDGSTIAPFETSQPTTYVLDLAQNPARWRPTPPMAFGRAYHNLTLLPDGTVLVTGGGQNTDTRDDGHAALAAELWSPTTETWTTMASMATPRMYHSTALLLPDGRVLSAGGGRFGNGGDSGDKVNAEIYSPPYLFKGPRPSVTAVASTIQYGSTFSVTTPDAARIRSVVLIRLGSVTHNFNHSQRFLNTLSFQTNGNTLQVQAPGTSTEALPGHYMLFIIDDNGVPSVAPIVEVK